MTSHRDLERRARKRTTALALAAVLSLLIPSASALCAPSAAMPADPPEAAKTAASTQAEAARRETPEPPPPDHEQLRFDERLEVLERLAPTPTIETLTRERLPAMPAGDGADLLRGFAGVSLGRMGGHGLEPRVRGQGEWNLKVLVDGASIHGGCPNRMDPPSSFAATGGFDRVTVIRGVQSLRYGAGGSAGTVLFERPAPPPGNATSWRAEAATGYGSWHAAPELGLNASWARKGLYLRADAESRRVDSYEDGSGEVVRSAFDSRVANLMVGLGDRERAFVELGYERSRTDDALFAGAGMDSPYDQGETLRLRIHRSAAAGPWAGLDVELYSSQVEHLMDNYSLRPLTTPMAMRVPTTSDTLGGRVSARLGSDDRLRLSLGADLERNERRALRFAGPDADRVTALQAVMWPDAELTQTGLFAEADRAVGPTSRLRAGLRLDAFEASARLADLAPVGANLSPNQLYRLYYGADAAPWEETGISALLRYERSPRPGWTLFAGVSRSLSAPDATARYLGAGNPVPARRWVGNPTLDVAAHHQVDLGVSRSAKDHRWNVTAFLDLVDDLVLRDRARAQPGILPADRASIYRNVEARLVGLEMDGIWSPPGPWTLRGSAGWVRGDNRTDGRPLAQIPPLQGVAALEHERNRWRGRVALRWALDQDRVDDDPATGSGLDFGPTPGHAILDLELAVPLGDGLRLLAGVDNLFDDTWADHLSRGNLFDPDPLRVNEPGRAARLRLRWIGNRAQPTGD